MVVVVDALSQLRAWESVNGILDWCKKVAGRNFFWLTGVASKSKGWYALLLNSEQKIKHYSEVASSDNSNLKRMLSCYKN